VAWKLQWRRAKALSALGKGAQAIDAFRAAMLDADRLRMAPLGYRLDTTFVRDKLPMAEEAVDTALAHHDAGAVAGFVELVKSRALAATISIPRVPAAVHTEQEAEFDTLSQQIDALAFAQYSGIRGEPRQRWQGSRGSGRRRRPADPARAWLSGRARLPCLAHPPAGGLHLSPTPWNSFDPQPHLGSVYQTRCAVLFLCDAPRGPARA
jgi:hypothetical protein